MDRFFVPPEVLASETVELDRELSHRLRHVLRLRAGAMVVFFDGRGREYEAVLEDMSAPAVQARVLQQREGIPEPRTRLVLYQSLVKGDRFDWVLEKGTELGVAAFVPLISRRSVMRPRGANSGRSARWRRIIVEAAEQCGRSVLPELAPVTDLGEAFDSAPGLRLLPWEEERALGLRTVLREALSEGVELPEVSLFVGPEGGFTRQEVDRARDGGVRVVSLGSRILRSETAGIVAAAAVLWELGELGA
jgi:16S rRNA (uracil1498-N3)-methyltransferase